MKWPYLGGVYRHKKRKKKEKEKKIIVPNHIVIDVIFNKKNLKMIKE